MITYHQDRPGVIADVTAVLARHNINVAFMRVFRVKKAENTVLIAETDEDISDSILAEIAKNSKVKPGKVLQPL